MENNNNIYDSNAKGVTYINVPSQRFVSIGGFGNDQFFGYYAILKDVRNAIAKKLGIEINSPLETYWYENDGRWEVDFTPNGDLHSKFLNMYAIPESVTEVVLKDVIAELSSKNEVVKTVKITVLNQGASMQLVHDGSSNVHGDDGIFASIRTLFGQMIFDGKKQNHYFHEVFVTELSENISSGKAVILLRQPIKA